MSEIRSVSVHLDADVAGYVAKMRLAGAETDKAFGSSSRSIDTTNRKLGQTESALGGVESKAKSVDSALRRVSTTTRKIGDSNDFSRAASKVDGFLGKLGLIPALAIAGSAALVPLAAAATGVAAAFAAPLVFAGGGLGLFALLGGAAIKTTQAQYKAIDTLEKKLAGLTKGTAEYAAVQKQIAVAQKAISPQQRAFHNSLETLQSDFAKFIRGPAGQDLLGPFTQGLQVADDLLPKSAPIIHAVSGALGGLFDEFDRYIQSPGFSRLEHDIAGQIGPDIRGFGHIIGNVTPGLAHLLDILGRRLSPELMHEVERLAGGFSHWANSRGARHDVQSFIAYFHEVGPGVAQTIGAVARALGHMVQALAPLGPPVLHVIAGIATAIGGIPVGTLTELGKTAAELVVFQKLGGFKVISKFGTGSALLGPSGAAGGAAALTSAARGGAVPVYVTNPGFTGKPGSGGVPPVIAPGSEISPAAAALQKADAAAAAARAAAIAAGKAPSEAAQAALDAFKGAQAASEAATARDILSFGGRIGIRGTIGKLLGGGVPLPTLGDIGNEVDGSRKPIALPPLTPAQRAQWKAMHADVVAVGTAVESLHTRLGKASQDLELVGHSADRALGASGATGTVENLGSKLNTIKGGPAAQQIELIGTAADRGFIKGAAGADNLQHHVDRLHGKQVDVTVNGGQSLAMLREIAALEASLRSKTITLTTIRATGGHSVGNADGGTIGGPRSPYGDKVLRYLAPGEEVISNRHGQADRWRPVLKRINGMADGGTVYGAGIFDGAGGQPAHLTPIMRVRMELHRLELGLKASTAELDKDRQARQALVQKRDQVASTITDSMRSQLLGVTSGGGAIWGPDATTTSTNPLQILRGDIHHARQFRRTIAQLRRRGLDGAAVGQITDLADAQQLAGLSNHQLHEFEKLFQRRQRLTRAAGASAGNLAYGQQIAAQTKVIEHQAADVHHLNHRIAETNKELAAIKKAIEKSSKQTGDAVGKKINDASTTAVRRRRKP